MLEKKICLKLYCSVECDTELEPCCPVSTLKALSRPFIVSFSFDLLPFYIIIEAIEISARSAEGLIRKYNRDTRRVKIFSRDCGLTGELRLASAKLLSRACPEINK